MSKEISEWTDLFISGTLLPGGRLNNQISGCLYHGPVILKEAKLFDFNINYQSSGKVDRGNKVLILDESEDMFLIKLLDGKSGWAEKNRIKTLEIY